MPDSPPILPTAHASPAVRVIEMVAFDAAQLLDVTGPLQVFATANETVARAGGEHPYAIRIVARPTR
jgi:hypothetical protein